MARCKNGKRINVRLSYGLLYCRLIQNLGSGMYYFYGGLLQIIGAIFELIIGNTFPCVVFGTFG